MNRNFLFAIDTASEEVIVSESPKGTNKINFVERIKRKDNDDLYKAVITLSEITKAANFNTSDFKAMDKVCQMMYKKHKETG
jgi:outer membrane lipoprotein-sorting protein